MLTADSLITMSTAAEMSPYGYPNLIAFMAMIAGLSELWQTQDRYSLAESHPLQGLGEIPSKGH